MRRGLSLLGGALLAVLLSQFPEYAQQYTQRLGGAVDQLSQAIAEFDTEAADNQLSRDEAIIDLERSNSVIAKSRADNFKTVLARHDQLNRSLLRIQNATPLERFNLMPQFFDTEIGGRTLDNFRPAVPVTLEGFLYAGFGLALGYFLVSVLYTLVTLPFRRRRYSYKY
jgi:hypothetical protein